MKKLQLSSTMIYNFCLCFYSVILILNSTFFDFLFPFFNVVVKLAKYFFVGALLFVFVDSKQSKNKIVFTFIISIITLFIFCIHIDKDLIILVLLLISFPKNQNLTKLSHTMSLLNIFVIFGIVILSKLGFLADIVTVQHGTVRHSLGFVGANAFANCVASSIFIYLYSKKNNIKLINAFLIFLLMILIFSITNSRFAFYFVVFDLIISLVMKNNLEKDNFFKKIIYFLSKYLFPFLLFFMIAITIYFSKNSNSELYLKINGIFTGRIWQSVYFYNKYGLSLLGHEIEIIGVKEAILSGKSWFGIDTAYLNYSLRYGLLFMIFFAVLYIKLGDRIKKKKDFYAAIYIVLICIMGITENILFLPNFNISLIFIAEMLSKKDDDR